MTRVITYGTYDKLHFGHIRLLERAKELGDYLVVGVTSDDFDKARGKINVQQSLAERIEAIRETGIADEIIVEEYEGQKIDDIRKYDIDIFTVGSDWIGKFDYLKDYCEVKYLERTKGVSSSEIREEENKIRLGFAGDTGQIEFTKYLSESKLVNGAIITGVFSEGPNETGLTDKWTVYDDYEELLDNCDAVYIAPHPEDRYSMSQKALLKNKHVLCKAPIALNGSESAELFELAEKNNLVLMEAIKTGYSTAYNRLLLLAKGGRIGDILSVDVSCTSLAEGWDLDDFRYRWNSIDAWGPIAMLPVFQLLGTEYKDVRFICKKSNENSKMDVFTEMDFLYSHSTATVKIGNGIKTEGDLVISGSKGYIYVPAPWWKTDYFEIRYEDPRNNKRYFYQLDGEGIRYELVAFIKEINDEKHKHYSNIDEEVSTCISRTIEKYYQGINVFFLD